MAARAYPGPRTAASRVAATARGSCVSWSWVKRSVREPALVRIAVARAVALEGVARAVEAPAVGLDSEAVVGEEEVDLDVGDVDVDAWRRQVVSAAELEESLLELGLGEGRAGGVRVECVLELLGSVVAGVGSGQGLEGGDVREPAVLRLVEAA